MTVSGEVIFQAKLDLSSFDRVFNRIEKALEWLPSIEFKADIGDIYKATDAFTDAVSRTSQFSQGMDVVANQLGNALAQATLEVLLLGFYNNHSWSFNFKLSWRQADQEITDPIESQCRSNAESKPFVLAEIFRNKHERPKDESCWHFANAARIAYLSVERPKYKE